MAAFFAHGYRRRKRAGTVVENRAKIPAVGRKSIAARVQEKKPRGNTRGQPERRRRAGIVVENRAEIPVAGRKPGSLVPGKGAGYFVEAVSCKAVTMFITEGIISGVSSNISVI